MVPAGVRVGDTAWSTSLWPKDGTYLLPLKDRVRRAESIDEGDTATVRLTVDLGTVTRTAERYRPARRARNAATELRLPHATLQ